MQTAFVCSRATVTYRAPIAASHCANQSDRLINDKAVLYLEQSGSLMSILCVRFVYIAFKQVLKIFQFMLLGTNLKVLQGLSVEWGAGFGACRLKAGSRRFGLLDDSAGLTIDFTYRPVIHGYFSLVL